jgi:hypothetical protein
MVFILARLDSVRASLLRLTLSFDFARSIFRSRADRLFFFFILSCVSSFFLATLVPIWLIAVAPLILGVPHLFAGFRYVPKLSSLDGRMWIRLGAFLSFAVSLLRLFHFQTLLINDWEILAAAIFVAIALLKTPKRYLAGAGLFLTVIAGSWYFPLWTLSLLAFAHNFVAFVFWYQAAKSREERHTVLRSLAIFSFTSALILAGVGDRFGLWGLLPQGWVFDPDFLVQGIFPAGDGMNAVWVGRILSAYAFGQSVHYFVWLKAVPEQVARQRVPLSFVQSGRELRKDLGPWLSWAAVAMSLASIAMIAWFSLESLRNFYLAISTAHGYFELAALPFILKWRA